MWCGQETTAHSEFRELPLIGSRTACPPPLPQDDMPQRANHILMLSLAATQYGLVDGEWADYVRRYLAHAGRPKGHICPSRQAQGQHLHREFFGPFYDLGFTHCNVWQ